MLAIALATLLLALLSVPTFGLGIDFHTVKIVRNIAGIPRDLRQLSLPTREYLIPLLLPALSVAIIGLVQGVGVGQAYPNPDGKYPDVSGDFLGQGVGNIAASWSAAFRLAGQFRGLC